MIPASSPYVDELAFSAIVRCSRDFRIPIKRLGDVILGRDGWKPSYFGASPAAELSALFRLSVEDLVWKHTTFPFGTAMMQPRYYKNALVNFLRPDFSTGGTSAVISNGSKGLVFRQYCQKCLDADMESLGQSYWRRRHNVTGAWVCPCHQIPLHRTAVPIHSSGEYALALPHEVQGLEVIRSDPTPLLLAIACTTAAWLDRPFGDPSPMNCVGYRALAIKNGFLKPGQEISAKKLASHVRSVLPEQYLAEIGLSGRQRETWASLMLRPGTLLPFAPIKHAVMKAVLGDEEAQHGANLGHVPTGGGLKAEPILTLDKRLEQATLQQLDVLRGMPERIRVQDFLSRAGALGAYKHRRSELPRLRDVINQFKASKFSVRPVKGKDNEHKEPGMA